MNRNVAIFTFLVIGLLLLALALNVQETRAGCAAVYPNLPGCVDNITPAPRPTPTPTPCIPQGWCRGRAPHKPGTPPGRR